MELSNSRRIAALLLAATGVLHLVLAPEYLGEEAYIGVGFIAGGLTALAVAWRIWSTEDLLAMALGALVAGGMAIGFILSRTVGLPGFHEAEWEASGVLSVLLEAGVVALTVPRLASGRTLTPARG